MTLCGDCRPDAPYDPQFCTLPKDHDGEWHVATIGPAGPGAIEIGRWPTVKEDEE